MKKFLAYIVSAAFTFVMCLCCLYSLTTQPGSERAPYAFGAAICFLIALIVAGYANSITWDGKKSKDKE